MPGNAWLINATAYGHGDALEQFFVDAIGVSQQNIIRDYTLILGKKDYDWLRNRFFQT